MLYQSLPDDLRDLGLKPILFRNGAEELAFHEPPFTSSIISKPGTSAVRGGKKDIYFDEAAHIPQFPKLWQAAIPATSRGDFDGRITVLSTPLGQSGLFYELWSDPKYSHHLIPWWHSRFFVKGALLAAEPYAVVAEAIERAPDMTTEERVEVFGSDRIKDILGLLGDYGAFRTEYECEFVDELDAYYPYDLIISNKDASLEVRKTYDSNYEPEGDVSIGVDLAKERDQTVFTVVEHTPKKKILYAHATQSDYEDQFVALRALVHSAQARRVSIDRTGAGNMFYERARNEGFGVPGVMIEGVNFNQSIKEKWATQFKGDLQVEKISIPNIKPLIDQIHGIKRTRTENNFYKFAGKHDDYFWSAMLALYGQGRRPVTFSRLGW